jgi:predicted nucleotidyltransferase
MSTFPIFVPNERLSDICRRNHIRKLSLFGSILHGDSNPTSDVDLLVEFDPAHVPGLRFFTIQDELSRIFERRVDLNTINDLSGYFRDAVLAEAEPIYVEA